MPHSREYEIDCEMRRLLRKMAEGSITQVERAELHDLQRERVKRMMPKAH